MKSTSNVLKGLLIVAIAAVAGVGYLSLQRSNLTSSDSNSTAYVGQAFPPLLFFDSKVSSKVSDTGCYDLKWSSINVTSCTSTWRPTVATNGAETVCLGKINADGVRVIDPKMGAITHTLSCSGPAGSVSRTLKIN